MFIYDNLTKDQLEFIIECSTKKEFSIESEMGEKENSVLETLKKLNETLEPSIGGFGSFRYFKDGEVYFTYNYNHKLDYNRVPFYGVGYLPLESLPALIKSHKINFVNKKIVEDVSKLLQVAEFVYKPEQNERIQKEVQAGRLAFYTTQTYSGDMSYFLLVEEGYKNISEMLTVGNS